ncbi:MAG TPA: NUDIX hydrolase [Bacteroidota bacterium]|nr:NUDIX hydrolase [Bacteroidota bacterium]
MPLQRWKKLTEKTLHKNSWWTYKVDSFEIGNEHRGEYHYVHTLGASLVIPVLPDGRIVLVRQYRYLCDRESLEFPCGGVKEGSSYEQTAREELAEEAGLDAQIMDQVGEFNPYNGVTNEICKIFIARQLRNVESSPDRTEEFEQTPLTADDLQRRVDSGEVWDGMTLAAWSLAQKKIR